MMMSRATKISSVARRSYVSLPCNINLSHPRLAIAKNMYKLKKITAADSEEAVRAALKDAITAEEVANQPNLSAFERNLLMTTAKTYHAPFVPNPHVWQNMPYGTYVYKEYLMNSNNFAFIFGFA